MPNASVFLRYEIFSGSPSPDSYPSPALRFIVPYRSKNREKDLSPRKKAGDSKPPSPNALRYLSWP
jgi:hypothetical protein